MIPFKKTLRKLLKTSGVVPARLGTAQRLICRPDRNSCRLGSLHVLNTNVGAGNATSRQACCFAYTNSCQMRLAEAPLTRPNDLGLFPPFASMFLTYWLLRVCHSARHYAVAPLYQSMLLGDTFCHLLHLRIQMF